MCGACCENIFMYVSDKSVLDSSVRKIRAFSLFSTSYISTDGQLDSPHNIKPKWAPHYDLGWQCEINVELKSYS